MQGLFTLFTVEEAEPHRGEETTQDPMLLLGFQPR